MASEYVDPSKRGQPQTYWFANLREYLRRAIDSLSLNVTLDGQYEILVDRRDRIHGPVRGLKGRIAVYTPPEFAHVRVPDKSVYALLYLVLAGKLDEFLSHLPADSFVHEATLVESIRPLGTLRKDGTLIQPQQLRSQQRRVLRQGTQHYCKLKKAYEEFLSEY